MEFDDFNHKETRNKYRKLKSENKMENDNDYSEVFEMDRTELREHLRSWKRENLPNNRKDKSIYDIFKEMKVI